MQDGLDAPRAFEASQLGGCGASQLSRNKRRKPGAVPPLRNGDAGRNSPLSAGARETLRDDLGSESIAFLACLNLKWIITTPSQSRKIMSTF